MLFDSLNAEEILRKKRAIRRELLGQDKVFVPKRIAILGGSTTSEFRDCLELFLLDSGIQPEFYESEFGRYYEDSVFGSEELESFRPELVFLFTSVANIQRWPELRNLREEVAVMAAAEAERLSACWAKLAARFDCPVVQNNFEPPATRLLGNSDFADHRGRVAYVNAVNQSLLAHARPGVYFLDLSYAASRFGLDRWHDRSAWHAYKLPCAMEAIPSVAQSAARLLGAIWGRSRKCLVLDLDNTLWGGIIGDDGPAGIRLGPESADGAAHAELQRYAKQLRSRGILLAVCSKNERDNALAGLCHPEGVLRPEDFAAIVANWQPKSDNIAGIARALNIGADSLVFLDDNPAEREIVRQNLPEVAVPEVGERVEAYASYLERGGYFEAVSVSEEDLSRAAMYQENQQREEFETHFDNYVDFLASLEMRAEIGPFRADLFDRIHQLINKTNQFNLTTRRCSREEVAAWAASPSHITLFGRLLDKFGDNGLVSIVTANVQGGVAGIDLWLMSCRVLKRGMELAMLEALVGEARRRGVNEIRGAYRKSPKNKMVENLLGDLGFQQIGRNGNGDSEWRVSLSQFPSSTPHFIKVNRSNDANPVASARNLP